MAAHIMVTPVSGFLMPSYGLWGYNVLVVHSPHQANTHKHKMNKIINKTKIFFYSLLNNHCLTKRGDKILYILTSLEIFLHLLLNLFLIICMRVNLSAGMYICVQVPEVA